MDDYIQGHPGTEGDPWRAVTSVKFLHHQKANGFAAACGVWRHVLECGHVQDRTDSKAHVARARCWNCGDKLRAEAAEDLHGSPNPGGMEAS